METTALIIAILLFVLGLIGTILPLLPGAALIIAGMVVYGLMTDFVSLGGVFFVVQTIAFLLIFLIDYVASAAGTKHFGGSDKAAWGALAGAIAGIFFGPGGIIVGPFLGAVLVELLLGAPYQQALRSGIGTLVGILGGTLLKISVEALMIVYFFVRIF